MSIAVFADTSWVTPSNTICKKNKGSIDQYGICQAKWEDAKEICHLHDARLPTIKELQKESQACTSKVKDTMVACYKKKGFLGSSSYWSSTTDKKYAGSAYGMNFYSAVAGSGSKGTLVNVRCIK